MNIETIFDSIGQIGRGITEVYQYFLEYFYDHEGYRNLWEEMLQGEVHHIEMLNRCLTLVSSERRLACDTLGRDIDYGELLSIIEGYKREIKEDLDINRALKIAFHLELLEIQDIFNELIKLPREPYFDILSDVHLDVRRNMGRLIAGIERFSTDQEFLYKVLELKGGIIERRSGADRRAGKDGFEGADRRGEDRRRDGLVKIVFKI